MMRKVTTPKGMRKVTTQKTMRKVTTQNALGAMCHELERAGPMRFPTSRNPIPSGQKSFLRSWVWPHGSLKLGPLFVTQQTRLKENA